MENQKKVMVGLKVLPEQKERFLQAAAADDRTLSSWLRKVLLDAVRGEE